MKFYTIPLLCLLIGINCYGQTSLPDTDPTSIPAGVTVQGGPGNSGGWTYNYGMKLTAWGSGARNFELMNTEKTASSTLAFRTYNPSSNLWNPWKEIVMKDQYGHFRFNVNPYSLASSELSGEIIISSSNQPGQWNYGGAISFTKIEGGYNNKRASIAAIQTGTDPDNVGLAFFTHTNTAADPLVQQVVINGSGNMGIGTKSPSSKLEIKNHGEGASLLKLSSERPWQFMQTGSGANTNLTLRSEVNSKSFRIESPTGLLNSMFFVSDENSSNKVLMVPYGGRVAIGTNAPDELLTVNGTIHSSEVRVDLDVPAPDYVFADDYQLTTLGETAVYIEENHHLPEIPSATEMEANGVELGEMNMLLLKKIEELTLHLIEKEKNEQEMLRRIENLEQKINER
ncbi:hypothetical protein [Reichenbachiella ulvae]|uniref:Chaperone of endosialidase n=1 Tax=Reichenbachiella ulvae TaxID=2980104 RepID=A0ABT3CUU8_9BACT|nr:hypothetical protein [Reichenbachiella ulvae]MCV9387470.1 hypothetical protein [Reichenbachiella ulvae]